MASPKDYVIERTQPPEFDTPIGATDSRMHAQIIAEAALEIAEKPCRVYILCRGKRVEVLEAS